MKLLYQLNKFLNLFLSFFLFSLLGWIYETLLFYVLYGNYYDRGYLNLPICPIYGTTITIMFILAVGGLLNTNFDQILVLNNPLNAPRSNVLDIYVYQTAMRGMRYSYASAIGLFKSVIAFILLFITNKITTKLNDTALF
jgi:hypothetical protein